MLKIIKNVYQILKFLSKTTITFNSKSSLLKIDCRDIDLIITSRNICNNYRSNRLSYYEYSLDNGFTTRLPFDVIRNTESFNELLIHSYKDLVNSGELDTVEQRLEFLETFSSSSYLTTEVDEEVKKLTNLK